MNTIDVTLFKHINGIPHVWALNWLMVAATFCGLGSVQSGVSLALILAGLFMNRLDLRKAGCAGLLAMLMSLVAIGITKDIWHRPRPLLQLFDVQLVNEQLFTRSFPSGHSSTAFAVAFAYSAFLPKLRYPLIAFACLVALSRVYLGVHFPLDTVYGGLMGSLLGIGSARIIRGHEASEEKSSGMKGNSASQAETI